MSLNNHRLTHIFIVITIIILSSCGSSKKNSEKQQYAKPVIENVAKHSKSEKGDALEKEARKWLGTKYKYGGTTRNGVDCSGFVMEVYRATFGITLPRNSAQQSRFCKEIKKKDLQKGDLVFFSINSSLINHVGLYLGKGRFIHASRKGVIISNLDEKYYKKHYQTSGRVQQVMGKSKKSKHKAQVSNRQSTLELNQNLTLEDIIEQKIDSIYENDL